ncbi:trypsin-like peptidase domain-containing protein [Corynebacterium sp.]|uniref:trypsin-like peptidase domain-containing protein n=1 Tax=Corynebacterium sp. TaxID=1720 RepID=UPI0026DCD9EA|nr:trypsin-like peptidase domain-containing protein [Corynebacterium sp.]MDO5033042.1 trypsin-like peptidase domain-containing protein [Corynebacterium sp.]
MNMRNSNTNNPGQGYPDEGAGRTGSFGAPSDSRGWNQPRSDHFPAAGGGQYPPFAQGPNGPGQSGPGHNGPSQPLQGNTSQTPGNFGPSFEQYPAPGAEPSGPAGSTGPHGPTGPHGDSTIAFVPQEPKKEKRSVGLGTALAMMLVGAIAAGGITGVAVGGLNNKNDTSAVNEALHNAPVANSTGKEPEAGSVEAVAAKVLPAVVSIYTLTPAGGAEGSGSIISPDGYVLTNHHVIAGADRNGRLEVTLNDGSRHTATFVASDPNTDVGVIKIDDVQDLPHLQFGDSDAAAVGQQVVAVGSPLGLNATVTSGIVSAKNRPVRASQEGGESSLIDAIQTDAAVNPGNSGGPLVDMEGNLVGMNSMIASLSSGGGEAGSIGLGFAIPSNFAKRMADQLINDGVTKHPTLGVKVNARDLGNGAQIVEVEPGGPADKAGLRRGDVVTRVNDRLIENADALIAAARSQDFGAKVTLEVKRGTSEETRQVEVTLTSE